MFRLVALPAPSDRERTQIYSQRYLQHFPAAGEVVIFDRSWYNRAGVESVMGFCTKEQYKTFLENCPKGESFFSENGIILSHFLSRIHYKEAPREKATLPKRSRKGEYDDQANLEGRRFVEERY